jgi:AbrB family looped-hinge helix DNA binding protein
MIDVVTRVTRKGQITIPVEFRRELGINEGDRIAWVREGNRLVLKPAESVVRRTAGIGRRYRHGPAPTVQEMKEAAHRAIVEDVVAELNQ